MTISLMLAAKSVIDLILPALTAIMAFVLAFLLARGKSRNVPARAKRVPRRGESTPPPRTPAPSPPLESYRSPSGSLPCFLLLGPSNSGKTALLTGLHRAFSGWGRRSIADLASGVARWHFPFAEVIEIAGSLFTPAVQDQHTERNWKNFLSHLQRRRPQRPLDGIVLTLPATQLAGGQAPATEDLQHHATQAAQQLKLLRDHLCFCFPTYVVITKCDSIPGYKSFVKGQLAPHLNEIFGWSNPYNLDAPFDPQWTAQAFSAVCRAISAQRVEFFSRPTVTDTEAGSAQRSDLFLFPNHLQELQAPLAGYLEHLFESGGHRNGLQFRGIYFSGSAAGAGNSSTIRRHHHENDEGNDIHGSAFTADLFEQKIFPERSLARPVETAFAQRRIELTLSRWLCAVAALLLFPGAIWGWYKLSQSAKQISPRLSEIRATLHEAHNLPTAGSAYAAIYAAQGLSGHNLQSVFLPASLIDSLDQQVQEIMPPVFNRLVYPGLRVELERKTRDLVRASEHSETTNDLVPVTNAAQRLSHFTDGLLDLESEIILYNALAPPREGHGKDMVGLAASLAPRTFADLPVHNTSGLDDIVRASSGISFDGQPWNKSTAARLELLVTAVLRESTNEEQLVTALDTLIGRVNLLEENKLDTYEQLNGLLQSLTQISAYVAAPDMQWIARGEGQIQLPDTLNRTLNRIFSRPARENILLCDAAHQENPCANLQLLQVSIEEMAHAHYVDLRKVILTAQTKTTGPLVAATDSKLQLSQPTIDLQTVLDRFLKLPFVAHEGTGSLRDVEPGQQLFWDNERLQAAIQDKQAYDKFFESELANTSDNLQDTFEEVALSRLAANMVDAVASAQQFQSLPSGEQAEQATTNEVRSFQGASQSLVQLLGQFSELGFDDNYQDLQRVSASHAFMVLSRIDRAFDVRKFYWPASGNFDAWTTSSPPTSAYGVHNSDEMATYLVAQRQDVQRYVASAQPLAAFLQQHNLKSQRQTPMIAKWQSIVGDLQKYESAPAASGLGSVEEFLSIGMDALVPPGCQTPAPPAASNLVYFVQVRRSLERALGGRCHLLSNQSAFRQYNQIADFFNQHLAGKFPFSAPSDDPTAPEADPADLAELFQRLDADGKSIRQGLQTSSGASPASISRITTFLNQLDSLRTFFAPLSSGQPGAVPTFDLAPVFRVNRNHETNGNQIIDWSLQVGANTFRNFDPPSTGRWTFGEPVKLMLRWAKDSPQQPVPMAPATANTSTRTVIFEYRDPWSLLRAMALHTPPSGDLDRSIDSDPQTLVFIAGQESATSATSRTQAATARDTRSNEIAKVFVRLRIYAPGKTDALRMPQFPVQAPAP